MKLSILPEGKKAKNRVVIRGRLSEIVDATMIRAWSRGDRGWGQIVLVIRN
jgi:hypothetical protein